MGLSWSIGSAESLGKGQNPCFGCRKSQTPRLNLLAFLQVLRQQVRRDLCRKTQRSAASQCSQYWARETNRVWRKAVLYINMSYLPVLARRANYTSRHIVLDGHFQSSEAGLLPRSVCF